MSWPLIATAPAGSTRRSASTVRTYALRTSRSQLSEEAMLRLPVPGAGDEVVLRLEELLAHAQRRRALEVRVAVFDVARHLVLGESIGAVADDLLGRDRLPVRGQHVRLDLLAAQLVGDGDDRDVLHLGVRADHVLDLGRRDVLAAAADDVLLASDEVV